MGFAGQVFAARVAIGLAMPSPRALTQAGSILAKFTGGVYKKLNQEQTKAASDRLRLAKQDLKRANKAIQQLQKEQDNSIRSQAKTSIRQTQAMFDQSAFKTKKSITDFKNYVSKVQPAAAPRLFSGMTKDMSAAKQYQRMVENFISLGKEERKVILNNMKARSQAMKTQAKDFKELVNAMGAGGGGAGAGMGGGPRPGSGGPYAGYGPLGPDYIVGEDKLMGWGGPGSKKAPSGWVENTTTLFPSDWQEEDYGLLNRIPQPVKKGDEFGWYKMVDKRDGTLKTKDEGVEKEVKKIADAVAPSSSAGLKLYDTPKLALTGPNIQTTGMWTPPDIHQGAAFGGEGPYDKFQGFNKGSWFPSVGGHPTSGGGPLGGMSPDEAVDFLDDIAQQAKELTEVDRVRNDMLKKDNRELADLEEWRRQAQKELTEATKELADAEHHLAQETERVIQETQQIIYLFKHEFVNNIRETVSALAAFFWQLEGLTGELREFEQELLNANSVFQLTRSELYDTGELITQFGQEFGMSMQNGATGLYQLASAGITANEAISVLPETLKLSMAVQGDHNTISKLTAQTLFGFGLPMSQAAEVTDKFAHAIQKSLIEYQDLTSAIKFALPFFTATGQSLDQLLGALQVLTNRALEAGIAGRGLRQALSEFAEKSDDNAAAFRKVGLEILNMDGTMKDLTVIAKEYAMIIGDDAVKSTELLTSLIQDLNVRGATAFIHLVQNADEFAQAVEETANAGGELDKMVREQNDAINAQVQILKNNVIAIFTMRDAAYEGTEFINGFHKAIVEFLETLKGLFMTEMADGTYQLTEFSLTLRNIAVKAVELFSKASEALVKIITDFTEAGFFNISMLKAFFAPLMAVLKVVQMLGPDVLKLYLSFRIYSRIIGLEAIPYTKIFTNTVDILKMGMSSFVGVLKHVIQSIKFYTIAVASGDGAQVATGLWSASLGKAKGILIGLTKALFSWQAITLAAVATMGIAASTTTDWSSITEGLSLGFKALISTLWVGLEPLIISIQNAREAFGGWLGDVTGMESRMILIRTMQEIGAFIGTFVQMGAKLLGFFIDIGVEIGKWFAGSLGPDSHFESFVQFWKDWVNPEVDIDWSNALSKSIDFFVDLAGMLVSAMVQAWDFVVNVIKDMATAGVDYATHSGAGTNTVTIDGQDYQYSIVAGVGGSFTPAQGGGAVTGMDNSIRENQQAQAVQSGQVVNAPTSSPGLYDTYVGTPSHNAQNYLLDSGWAYWNPFGGDAVAAEHAQPLPNQSGGPISAYGRMAAGGGMNNGSPLLVGELGPEIFIPSTSGRIVSNKDLNTRRTRSMLDDWRNRGSGGGGGASVMTVGTLVSANSISKNSKISIDSYAGVV
jgi:TP901 family phage tail tape measure protein